MGQLEQPADLETNQKANAERLLCLPDFIASPY